MMRCMLTVVAFVWPLPVPADWAAGKQIHVRAPRVKCVRGVSGMHRIITILPLATTFKVITDTTYECAPSTLSSVVPKTFLHIESYYPIFRTADGGAGKKDAGRPFYQRRGRRSAR